MMHHAPCVHAFHQPRAICAEQRRQPFLRDRIIPWQILTEVRETDRGVPAVAFFLAGERYHRAGRQMPRRYRSQIVELDRETSASRRTTPHHPARGIELQKLGHVRDGPIRVEDAAHLMLWCERPHLSASTCSNRTSAALSRYLRRRAPCSRRKTSSTRW